MKSVRLVVEYDAEVLHPTHELVCESPRIEREYLLEAVAEALECVPTTASTLLRRGEARLVADVVDGGSVR